MKIRTKLHILAVGLILSLLLSGAYGLFGSMKQQELTQSLIKQEVLQYNMKNLQYLIVELSNDERGYLIKGDESFLQDMQMKKRNIEVTLSNTSKILEQRESKRLKQAMKGYFDFSDTVVSSYKSGDEKKAEDIHFVDALSQRKNVLQPVLDTIEMKVERNIQIQNQQSKDQTALFNKVYIGILFGLSVLAGFFTLLIARSFLRPIRRLHLKIEEITKGEGDLTQTLSIGTKDEIGVLANQFDDFIVSLRQLIFRVNESTELVASTAEELTSNAEQTSYSIEQITASVQEVATVSQQQIHTVETSVQAVAETHAQVTAISSFTDEVVGLIWTASEQASEGEIFVLKPPVK